MKKAAIILALLLSGGFIYNLSTTTDTEKIQNKEITPLVNEESDLTI